MSARFEEYRPYTPEQVRLERLAGEVPNPEELERMNALVREILETYSEADYFGERFDEGVAYIRSMLAQSGVVPRGRLLEFGAGTCKAAAVAVAEGDVDEAVCVDFSEPLLAEIAPRVVSRVGADLGRFRFVIGDMHRVEQLGEAFDVVVCYEAVHHLMLPERFFEVLRRIVRPGGQVICFREPALPEVAVRTRAYAQWAEKHHRLRSLGENENIYRVDEYRRMAGDGWSFRRLEQSRPSRLRTALFNRAAPVVWHTPFDVAYVLQRTG